MARARDEADLTGKGKRGRPRLSEQERESRRAWKALFREILDSAHISSEKLAKQMTEVRSRRPLSAQDIVKWRFEPEDGGDLRVPSEPELQLLIAALRELGVWRDKKKSTNYERRLFEVLGFPYDLLDWDKVRNEAVDSCLTRAIVIESVVIPQNRTGVLELLKNPTALDSFVTFLLKDGHFLSISYDVDERIPMITRTEETNAKRTATHQTISFEQMPGLFKGDLQSLLQVKDEDAAIYDEVFKKARQRLRFALLRPPDKLFVYPYCQPGSRILIGANPSSTFGPLAKAIPPSWWHRRNIETYLQKSPVVLKQFDTIQSAEEGKIEDLVGLVPSPEMELQKFNRWFCQLQEEKKVLFFELEPDDSVEFERMMNESTTDPLLREVVLKN